MEHHNSKKEMKERMKETKKHSPPGLQVKTKSCYAEKTMGYKFRKRWVLCKQCRKSRDFPGPGLLNF